MRRNDNRNDDRGQDQKYYGGQDNNFDRTYDSSSYGGSQNNRGSGAPSRPNNGYADNYNNSNNYQDGRQGGGYQDNNVRQGDNRQNNNVRQGDNRQDNDVRQGDNYQDGSRNNNQRPAPRDNAYRPMEDMQMRENSPQPIRPQGVDMGGGASNVVVSYPKTYQEIKQLIDSLRSKQAIIIDIIKLDTSDAQRVLDFMSGANYALNGSMQRLNTTMFLFTPGGVSIKIPYDVNAKRTK